MRYEDTTGAWRRRRSTTTGHKWVCHVREASSSCLRSAKIFSRPQRRRSAPWKVRRLPQTSLRRQHVIVPDAVTTGSHGIVEVHGHERRARVFTRRATRSRRHPRRPEIRRLLLLRRPSQPILADGRSLRGRWWLAGRSDHCGAFVVFHGHGNVSPLVITRKRPWRRRIGRWIVFPVGRGFRSWGQTMVLQVLRVKVSQTFPLFVLTSRGSFTERLRLFKDFVAELRPHVASGRVVLRSVCKDGLHFLLRQDFPRARRSWLPGW